MQTLHASPYAGEWYPADRAELRDLVTELLANSSVRTGSFIRPGGLAFLVPHAAPVYSGTVAAASYRHIAAYRPRRIVVLGFSHQRGVEGIGIPQIETISTPLGVTEIDSVGGRELTSAAPFHISPESQLCDHSVEIQLPFLQAAAPEATVLPLYVGRLSPAQRAAAAARLRWLLDGETVFVASSDLTHFGRGFGYVPFPVNDETGLRLKELDGGVIGAAASIDPDLFLAEIQKTRATVCGFDPIALLLATLQAAQREEIYQETLDYQTSADMTSDYSHSVSYGAAGYFPSSSFELSPDACLALANSAAATLADTRAAGRRSIVEPTRPTPELKQKLGAFVTVYQDGQLHGCIGRIHDPEPLYKTIPRLALSAATEDARFAPLSPIGKLAVEVSVLTPMKRIASRRRLIAGEHGGLLESGPRSGLLLPKVATEHGWNSAQFLDALARKAGLSPAAYESRDARLSVFRAQVFQGE